MANEDLAKARGAFQGFCVASANDIRDLRRAAEVATNSTPTGSPS